MKTTKQLLVITLLNLFVIAKINANNNFNSKGLESTYSVSSIMADDPNLVLSVSNINARIDVNISFNGNEGTQGVLKIYNSSNQLVSQFDIELKNSPNYATINLNEYSSGTYTFELTTQSGVHTSHLNI